MDMNAYFLEIYEYNYWANEAVLAVAESLNPDQFTGQVGPSWSSVRNMLVHIMGAEWIWLSRWQGISPQTMLRGENFQDTRAIRERWQQIEANLRAFLRSLSADQLSEEVPYTTTGGRSYSLKLWQLLAHVANHGSHHRGELADMFTLLNVSHPQDDMNAYFLQASGQLKT